MGKKPERTIVVLSLSIFFWLNHLLPPPLPAAPRAQGDAFSAVDTAPGAVEKAGAAKRQGKQAKKKPSVVLIMAGVVVLGMTAGALIIFVFKNRYDINGTWQFTWDYPGGTYSGAGTVTFSGSLRSGDLSADWGSGEEAMQGFGTFTAEKKELSFEITWDESTIVTHQGKFLDVDTIAGTLTTNDGVPGNWSATRIE